MNKEKRREEILKTFDEAPDFVTFFINEIISQEEAIIDEAVREFANDVFDRVNILDGANLLLRTINELLKDRGMKEI